MSQAGGSLEGRTRRQRSCPPSKNRRGLLEAYTGFGHAVPTMVAVAGGMGDGGGGSGEPEQTEKLVAPLLLSRHHDPTAAS